MIKVKLFADWMDFIPEYNENKKCAKSEIISCKIKHVSQADQDKMTDRMIDDNRKGFRAKKGLKFSSAQLEMINEHVKDIKNVFGIEEDGSEKQITTMKEMYYAPYLKGLFEEISNALDAATALTPDEEKN